MKVSAPKFKSSSGRQYDLSKTELQSTVNAFKIVCVCDCCIRFITDLYNAQLFLTVYHSK